MEGCKTCKVGPFWVLVSEEIIGYSHVLTDEEIEEIRKGMPDPSPSHNELWPQLAKPRELIGRSYMSVPRGRVVYRPKDDFFEVYIAPEVSGSQKTKSAVEQFFGLQGRKIRWNTGDYHYRTQPELLDDTDDFLNY